MFKLYRKKTGGLCYKVISWKTLPFLTSIKDIYEPNVLVLQHQEGNCYTISSEEFWELFEGVEDADIPPAYRNDFNLSDNQQITDNEAKSKNT